MSGGVGNRPAASRWDVWTLERGAPGWMAGLERMGVVPERLRVIGDARALEGVRVAVAGARACTGYGEHVTMEFVGAMARDGVRLLSGAGYGIEGAAVRAACAGVRDGGPAPVVILAGGLSRWYPAGHHELLRRVVECGGALVSAQDDDTAPRRELFRYSRELIAAMAAALVIVEAGARSSALDMAADAVRFGRTVCAVPGPVTSAASYGSNALLRDRAAWAVSSWADVPRVIGAELVAMGGAR